MKKQKMGAKRHITIRIPEALCLDIEARSIIDHVTFAQEAVMLLEKAVIPSHDADLPTSYRVTRERALMQDRVDGHRQIIHDLRHQLADSEEAYAALQREEAP